MNRVATLMQKGLDAIKPPSGIRDLEGCVGNQSKSGDSDDVGDIKTLKRSIIRNIQEYVVSGSCQTGCRRVEGSAKRRFFGAIV